tara:strand:+ start:96 stop:248 length:153 start_codon:yes stop_codon:yes gene_type:complete
MWGPWSAPVPYCSEEQLKKWKQLDPKEFWYKMLIVFWIILIGLFAILLVV